MLALTIEQTIVMNKTRTIPSRGIICAHPGRVKRIAEEFFQEAVLHTDYRGYQIYVGTYLGVRFFVANTGIGAPAAAFLLEELIAFGAKYIIRVGSDDSNFSKHCLKLVEKTTVPIGLALEYGQNPELAISADRNLKLRIVELANEGMLMRSSNKHIDGYYVDNFHSQRGKSFSSSDMESGALYLLGKVHNLAMATILVSYQKHGVPTEFSNQVRELEDKAIELALKAMISA